MNGNKIYAYINIRLSMYDDTKNEIELFSTREKALAKFQSDHEAWLKEMRSYNEELSDDDFDYYINEWNMDDIDTNDGDKHLSYCDYDGNEYIFSIQVKEVK